MFYLSIAFFLHQHQVLMIRFNLKTGECQKEQLLVFLHLCCRTARSAPAAGLPPPRFRFQLQSEKFGCEIRIGALQ